MKLNKMIPMLILSLSFSLQGAPKTVVTDIFANGSGCPTMYPKIKVFKNSINIFTHEMAASLKPGDRLQRKNCQVTVNIKPRDGWYYEVEQVRVSGWSDLDKNIVGSAKVSAYIQGYSENDFVDMDFRGPSRTGYVLRNWSQLKSQCGEDRALNINTSILLRNRKYSGDFWGYLRMNEKIGLKINWKRCS